MCVHEQRSTVESNSRHNAPFLTYLTVFKARIGVVNLVLDATGFGYLPPETLSRKLTALFADRVPLSVDNVSNDSIFSYLLDKRLVGAHRPRTSGRYQDFALTRSSRWLATDRAGQALNEVPIYRVDLWFADLRLPSTVGVPTPDNVDEVIELSRQLALITRAKNTWTAAGQLVAGLRSRGRQASANEENPILLSLEAPALLRQVLVVDGLILRHTISHLVNHAPQTVRRDAVALVLPQIAQKALDDARRLRKAPAEIAAAKAFVELLSKTAAKRSTQSGAPGVLEHRTSPRLEWLTDFGVLQKTNLAKNGFEYVVSPDASILNRELANPPDGSHWSENAALAYWRSARFFERLRTASAKLELSSAIVEGYRVMQRSVGPASIRDVAFAACVVCSDMSISYEKMITHLVSWATNTEGVTVSGGRYSRGPELIHVLSKVLGE